MIISPQEISSTLKVKEETNYVCGWLEYMIRPLTKLTVGRYSINLYLRIYSVLDMSVRDVIVNIPDNVEEISDKNYTSGFKNFNTLKVLRQVLVSYSDLTYTMQYLLF